MLTKKKKLSKIDVYLNKMNYSNWIQIVLIGLILMFQGKLSKIYGGTRVLIGIIAVIIGVYFYSIRVTKRVHKQRIEYIKKLKKLNLPEV